jgi:hypothetical protein
MLTPIFNPPPIDDGHIILKHGVVMAPMTGSGGVPVSELSITGYGCMIMFALYYGQCASLGELIITRGILQSVEASGMSGVPGLLYELLFEDRVWLWRHFMLKAVTSMLSFDMLVERQYLK